MGVIVYCNLGVRDVEIPAEKPERTPPARIYGAAIRERLQKGELAAEALAFPILKPALDYILRRSNNVIHHLILIATDQAADVQPRFRNNDTLHYAALAAAVLAPRYGERIAQVSVELIGVNPRMNPNFYHDTLNVYGPLIRRYALESDGRYFLLASGGIPACNTALLLQGIWQFGEHCELVYQSEEGSPLAFNMDAMKRQAAAQFVERYDFSAALQLSGVLISDTARHLLRYAQARLWFDFVTAEKHLDAARQNAFLRSQLNPIYRELELYLTKPSGTKAVTEREKALIAEVYHNALVAWENRRYIDFLGRAVRFYEAVLHRLTTDLYENGRLSQPFSAASLNEQPELRRLLLDTLQNLALAEPPATTRGMAQLRQDLEASFNLDELQTLAFDVDIKYENLAGDTLQAKTRELVDYVLRHGRFDELLARVYRLRPQLVPPEMDRSGRLQVIAPILRRLEQLTPLREQSVIMHGYTSVTPEILHQTYNQGEAGEGFSATQDMFETCLAMDIQAANPFIQIRDMIKALLLTNHE